MQFICYSFFPVAYCKVFFLHAIIVAAGFLFSAPAAAAIQVVQINQLPDELQTSKQLSIHPHVPPFNSPSQSIQAIRSTITSNNLPFQAENFSKEMVTLASTSSSSSSSSLLSSFFKQKNNNKRLLGQSKQCQEECYVALHFLLLVEPRKSNRPKTYRDTGFQKQVSNHFQYKAKLQGGSSVYKKCDFFLRSLKTVSSFKGANEERKNTSYWMHFSKQTGQPVAQWALL